MTGAHPFAPDRQRLLLITGMSGSGKSQALHALEDVGFYCVDNLPPELLAPLLAIERRSPGPLAVAMDVRSGTSLPQLPLLLASLGAQGVQVTTLFFDASTETLVHRYSESRRRHPLSGLARTSTTGQASTGQTSDGAHALIEAIEQERAMLADLRERAHVIDTSFTRTAQLQRYVKDLVEAPRAALTLVFESFAFKRGIPLAADFVFDVRMLPNPHYDPALRPLTGRDAPVAAFLAAQPEVQRMQRHIEDFLRAWLDALARDHRSYVTVAIGCTGGKHRSVFLVEQLATTFGHEWLTLVRHREQDAR